MIINERYKLLKKDLNYCNNCYFIQVYDMQEKEYFTIWHRCTYMFYSLKEILKMVFDLFVKLLKNEFICFTDRIEFINKNNLEIDYN